MVLDYVLIVELNFLAEPQKSQTFHNDYTYNDDENDDEDQTDNGYEVYDGGKSNMNVII